jgi:tetratricopeptide (TPR) repeat protein
VNDAVALADVARGLPPEALGPFRGLASYDVADAAVFFGRERETREALQLLRERGIVFVVGAPGSGRRSLLRAGVVAAIANGALGEEPRAWDVVGPAFFAGGTAQRAELTARRDRDGRGIALVVERLDETLRGEGGRAVADLLTSLAERPEQGVCAIAAVRSDRMEAVLADGGDAFARALLGCAVPLSPLDAAAWRDVAERSVTAYGYSWDDATPGSSSMLRTSFALARAWERRDVEGKRIPSPSAGAERALEAFADEALERVLERGVRAGDVARELLVALTARARKVGELAQGEPREKVLAELAASGLARLDAGWARLGHDALATEWPTLARWLRDGPRALPVDRRREERPPATAVTPRTPTRLRGVTVAAWMLACAGLAGAAFAEVKREAAVDASRAARADAEALSRRSRAGDLFAAVPPDAGPTDRVASFVRVVAEDPTWPDARLALARAYADRAAEVDGTDDGDDASGLRTRALAEASAAISLGGAARGYFLEGEIDEDLGDRAAARGPFLDAARITDGMGHGEVDDYIAHASLAEIAADEHRWADVVAEATRALAAKADDDRTLWLRGRAHLVLGETDAALADASRLRAGSARDLVFLANAALARGDTSGAGNVLASAARRRPRAALVLDAHARWALREGALARAEKLADAAVDAGERDATPYIGRALVRTAKGEGEHAAFDLAKALELDPLDEDAKRAQSAPPQPPDAALAPAHASRDRAQARLALADLDGAWLDVERAVAGDPLDPDALLLRVRIAIASGRAPAMLRELGADLTLASRAAPDLQGAADALRAQLPEGKTP